MIPIKDITIVPDWTKGMSLIIKPTEACNFKCTFCSSTHITDDKQTILDIDLIFSFLKRYPNTETIIVNGGDPLMVKPYYYKEILYYLDKENLRATLSFTTNLWAFFKNPEPWIEIFKHKRVGVGTSFNYGDTRRVTEEKVYTEDLFLQVIHYFEELIGYKPNFISVITDENLDSAIDNVKLAKRLGVECKLNYGMASGDQSSPLVLSKIYKVYIEIFHQNLWQWEFNTKQMMMRFNNSNTMCPQSRNCDKGIRCLQPSGDYYSCGAFGDDREHAINFNAEVYASQFYTPLSSDIQLFSMKHDCLGCPMFKICNGCRKTIKDMKQHNLVEEHCSLMKTLAPSILNVYEKSKNLNIDLTG